VDKKLDLKKDVMLNTVVTGASFDTKSCRWNVELNSGEVYDCKYFVLCSGFAAKHYIPPFRGMHKFKGIMHHTGKETFFILIFSQLTDDSKIPTRRN
jgi:cation diffusion facilitator CzcD-associated flavoprotein CzcO